MKLLSAFTLSVLCSAMALAEDAPALAPAPAPEVGAPAISAPGVSDRKMSPEMKQYIDRLATIRNARDKKAKEAVDAASGIETRKAAMAEENEDVKKLADEITELSAKLAEAQKALDAIYAEDDAIKTLTVQKTAAENERDAKQRELNTAVATAMHQRMNRPGESGREGGPRMRHPGHRTPPGAWREGDPIPEGAIVSPTPAEQPAE